jgi:hypothetical protein
MHEANADREEFLRQAGKLFDELLARTGATGETFDDIEVQAKTIGTELARKLLQARLLAEEQAHNEPVLCPQCGRQMRRLPTGGARNLDTTSGPVHYARRHAICDHCRESFSPSGPPAEDPATRTLQPPRSNDQ